MKHHQEHHKFFHSTTKPSKQYPAKPWSNLKLKTIPGGEGQATSSKSRRRRTSPAAEPGGEGQARS
jgi:hypothetical protein